MSGDKTTKAASPQGPTAEQLWSVMDFAHRFPDLTRQLVSVLTEEEIQSSDISQEYIENFVFPPLAAPDPRTLKAKKKSFRQPPSEEEEKTLPLFAQGNLAPESLSIPRPEPGRKKRKRPFLSYLLNLFTVAFVFFLLWFYGLHSIYQHPESFDTLSQVLAR
jgi:hypothetical protein